jgi:membrane protease YdiL (CAAX protease family)
MPSRRRAALEILLLFALVFGGGGSIESPFVALPLIAAEVALALVLVRPWSRIHGGVGWRLLVVASLLFAVAAPTLVERPGFLAQARQLGVEIADVTPREGDPEVAGGIAEVRGIIVGSAADGLLQKDDRIVGIGGSPLARQSPTGDLARRIQQPELAEDTTVQVLRDGTLRDLRVHLPRARRDPAASLARGLDRVRRISRDHVVVAASLRDFFLIVFLVFLVRSDGQPLSAIGIVREGALREVRASFLVALGTFGAQIAAALPIAVLGAIAGIAEREAKQRAGTITMMADQGSIPTFVAALIVAAAFEEIAFRAFLTPRLRSMTGSWIAAAAIASLVFGAGHLYEGTLAVAQTAVLGIYFTVVYVLRRRVISVSLAHAMFNTVMFLVARVLLPSVMRLKGLSP